MVIIKNAHFRIKNVSLIQIAKEFTLFQYQLMMMVHLIKGKSILNIVKKNAKREMKLHVNSQPI